MRVLPGCCPDPGHRQTACWVAGIVRPQPPASLISEFPHAPVGGRLRTPPTSGPHEFIAHSHAHRDWCGGGRGHRRGTLNRSYCPREVTPKLAASSRLHAASTAFAGPSCATEPAPSLCAWCAGRRLRFEVAVSASSARPPPREAVPRGRRPAAGVLFRIRPHRFPDLMQLGNKAE